MNEIDLADAVVDIQFTPPTNVPGRSSEIDEPARSTMLVPVVRFDVSPLAMNPIRTSVSLVLTITQAKFRVFATMTFADEPEAGQLISADVPPVACDQAGAATRSSARSCAATRIESRLRFIFGGPPMWDKLVSFIVGTIFGLVLALLFFTSQH